jgi:hypothetical protein
MPVTQFTTVSTAGVAVPTITSPEQTSSAVSLSWTSIAGATSYDIFATPASGSRSYSARVVGSTSTTITGLNPNTSYTWEVYANTAAGVLVQATLTSIYQPILNNYSVVIPGTLSIGGNTKTFARSWIIKLYPGDFSDVSFTGVKVGFLNPSTTTAYNIKHMSVGRFSDTELTQNASTGFVTLATDQSVPAGTVDWNDEAVMPGVWRSALHSVTPTESNGIQVAVELDTNHPECIWGTSYSNVGIGWSAGNTLLSNSLTTSWDISSPSGAFGEHPCMFVEFFGLSKSIVWLPVVGDSHIAGIGDQDKPSNPYALPGRLAARFSGSKRIAPINCGRSGHTTDIIAQRFAWMCDTFDVRCAMVEGFSINNITNYIEYSQFRTDWQAVESTEISKGVHVLPILGAGADGLPDHSEDWWTPMKAEQDWLIARKPETVTGIRTTVQNMTTGGYNTGYVFSDGGHPNDAGYTQWEADSYLAVQNGIEYWAGNLNW